MLNKLYKKLESNRVPVEMYDNAIHIYDVDEKEVHVYIENNQLEIYLYKNEECLECELFDNVNIAYYHIKGFL